MPAMNDGLAPTPRAGITTPMRPLPIAGEGERVGSLVARWKAESCATAGAVSPGTRKQNAARMSRGNKGIFMRRVSR
jgi:hypothetical protein